MSVATVVTRGFGAAGSVALVVTGGYSLPAAPAEAPGQIVRLRARHDLISCLRARHDLISCLRARHDFIVRLRGSQEMAETEHIDSCYGDAKRLEFTVKKRDGTPEDITGWTFALEVVADWEDEDAEPVLSKSNASFVITSALLGKAYVPITTGEAQFSGGPGVYGYAISRTNSGYEGVIVKGKYDVDETRVSGT